MASRNIQILLQQLFRRLNKRDRHAANDMPLSMTVKQLDTRVISNEAYGSRIVFIHDERVAAEWGRGWCRAFEAWEEGAVGAAKDDLEGVAMEMEGMCAVAVVGDLELDYGAEGEEDGIYRAVDAAVEEVFGGCAEECVECGYFGGYVGVAVQQGVRDEVAVCVEVCCYGYAGRCQVWVFKRCWHITHN